MHAVTNSYSPSNGTLLVSARAETKTSLQQETMVIKIRYFLC